MPRFRFYVNWTNREGDYETSGHLAASPAEAVKFQEYHLRQLERIDGVEPEPDLIEMEGGACHLLTKPERVEIAAQFRDEIQAINDTLAAKRLGAIFAAAAE